MSKISKKLKRTGPITTIIFLIIVVSVISFVLNLLGVRGFTTEAGTLETSIVLFLCITKITISAELFKKCRNTVSL